MHRLSCSRFSTHLYENQNGKGDRLEAELGFTTQLPTVSSAQAMSSAIASSLCLPSSCPIPQKTADFILLVSVPVQVQVLSTERLLANKHGNSKKDIAFTWCLLQRRPRLHCISVPSTLSPCDLLQKRVKATPSLCCSNMVLMY